jgi:hypothetical protein
MEFEPISIDTVAGPAGGWAAPPMRRRLALGGSAQPCPAIRACDRGCFETPAVGPRPFLQREGNFAKAPLGRPGLTSSHATSAQQVAVVRHWAGRRGMKLAVVSVRA